MITSIGFLLILVINAGCPKPCIEANYSFNVNAQIGPDADSVRVGDTIFLTSNFSTKLRDVVSGDSINYSNSEGIGSDLSILKLITGVYPGQDAAKNFEFISITGKIYNDPGIPSPNRVQQLTYQEDNNSYQLKIGIIPKQTGLYYLGVDNGLSIGRKSSHSCEKAAFSINLNNTNQHLKYFSEWNSNNSLTTYEQQRVCFLKVYLKK